jgi:outer membrane protein assembly factor BamB
MRNSTVLYKTIGLICVLATVGCSTKKKIAGNRELILPSSKGVDIDKSLILQQINLPPCCSSDKCTQRNGSCTHKATHLCFDVMGAKKLWKIFIGREAGYTERFLSNLVIHNGVAFGGTPSGRVFALDLNSRKILWRTVITGRIDDSAKIGGVAITSNGNIVATTALGEVVLIDAASGDVKKKINVECTIRSAPTISGNYIVVQGNNNSLCVLNDNLDILWTKEEAPEGLLFFGNGSPSVDKEIVFAAYSTGEYKAYDLRSGSELWFDYMISQFQDDGVGNLLHVYASQVVSDDIVFTLGHGGQLVANQCISGARLWGIAFSGLHAPAIIGDWLFAIDDNAFVYCLQKATGRGRWYTQLPRNENNVVPSKWTNPIIAGNCVVVVTDAGDIVCLDANSGRELRTIKSDIKDPSDAVVVKNTLYVLSSKGYLHAFG